MATPSGQGNLFEQPVAANNGLFEHSLPLSAELLRSWQERIHQFQAPLFPPLRLSSGIGIQQQSKSNCFPATTPIR